MNKLRSSCRSMKWYSWQRLRSRNEACSWDKNWEWKKERNFWMNISFGKKMKAVTHLEVPLSPFTYVRDSRQTARNTGTVRNKIMMILILDELPYREKALRTFLKDEWTLHIANVVQEGRGGEGGGRGVKGMGRGGREGKERRNNIPFTVH